MPPFRTPKRLTLVVLAGLLVVSVPVLAYAGTVIAAWRSGSPTVRSLGPLPAATWRPSAEDFVPATGGSLGAYRFSQSFSVPAPRLSGIVPTEGLVTVRVTVPDSATLGFAEVLEEHGGFCLVRGVLVLGESDGGPELFSYIAAVDALEEGWPTSFEGGTTTTTQLIGYLDPNDLPALSDVNVIAEARCNTVDDASEFVNHPIQFSESPEIIVEIRSIRFLAY